MLEIEKEVEIFCLYLTKRKSTPNLVIRYKYAISQLGATITKKEENIILDTLL
jgi:hypothetical protein